MNVTLAVSANNAKDYAKRISLQSQIEGFATLDQMEVSDKRWSCQKPKA